MRKLYWVELAADYGGWHIAESHEEAAKQIFDNAYGDGYDLVSHELDEGFVHNWSVYDYNDNLVDDIFVWNEEEFEARNQRSLSAPPVRLHYKA